MPPLPLDSDTPLPIFNSDMTEIFSGNDNIRTIEELEKAISALFWYRHDNNLEFAVAFD